MSFVREAGSTSLAQFTVPFDGTHNSIPANMIAPSALYNSLNVFIREGRLRARPGMLSYANAIFGQPIIGGDMAVTLAGKVLVAICKEALFTLAAGTSNWILDTNIPFALDNHTSISTTFLETSGKYVMVIAAPGYVLKVWAYGEGATAIVENDELTEGDVPTAISVCTAASRIIALISPHTLRWTKTLRYDSWPALAVAKVAQTNDAGICVRSLSTLDFAVYKERSIYVAKAQSGTDAQAFNIQFSQAVEGPAGEHAVVSVEESHMYMTKNGRIGIFDGTNKVQWVADGIWLYLQRQIDPVFAHKIFGFYDLRLHTVTYFWPPLGQNGQMKGIVTVNLPVQGSGIEPVQLYKRYIAAAFLGFTEIPCSYGYEQNFDNFICRSLIFRSDVSSSFILDEDTNNDANLGFLCSFQTGLTPLPDMKHYNISVENLFERADGNGQVQVRCVTSDALENKGGTIQIASEQILDLNNLVSQEYMGFNIPCRFFGLQYAWVSSDSTVNWAGTAIYGRTLT